LALVVCGVTRGRRSSGEEQRKGQSDRAGGQKKEPWKKKTSNISLQKEALDNKEVDRVIVNLDKKWGGI